MDTDRLVAALRRREETALSELYDRYGRIVHGFVLRMTGDPGMAEELTLDAFLHVWQQADQLEVRGGAVQSWLFTVARSRAIDRLRAARATKRAPAEDPVPAERLRQPEEAAELDERKRLVQAAMGQLAPEQRHALELAYYEGLSHSEIAARLGQPLGTVKTRIRQAMLNLRRTLNPVLSPAS